MVAFRNVAGNTGVNNWWDNGNNQIAFCRGNNAFIAINGDNWDLNQTLQVWLNIIVYTFSPTNEWLELEDKMIETLLYSF